MIVFHVCIKNKVRSYFVCSLRFGFERYKRDLAYSKWKKQITLFPLFILFSWNYFDLHKFSLTALFFHHSNWWLSLPFSRERRYSEESCSISLFPGSCTAYLIASWHSYCYIWLFYSIYCHFIGYLVECLHLKRALHGLTKAEEILSQIHARYFSHTVSFSPLVKEPVPVQERLKDFGFHISVYRLSWQDSVVNKTCSSSFKSKSFRKFQQKLPNTLCFEKHNDPQM